ncbi:YceI family protein [Lacihabitans sp. LS3-19]|uniref:YceI family protein n=1 Tax=Lacihabitans sp. LS3-19 TaxID=2487335 RepID=UPI0020CC41B8|nr:YceI family protein [Lacihabitans sp. LS3-19]MCP9768899.1 YceI family protein [Lacihabitans sp. LS3-19]
MKKIIIFLLGISSGAFSQNYYVCKAGQTSFFSETPMENISALDNKVAAVIDTDKNEIAVKITMTDFKFKNHLMEEHFNENYMESDKFPLGTFKGKIQETVDYSKNGSYDITAVGSLNMHGVTKERTLKGKMEILNGQIKLNCDFEIPLKDHKIDIPTLVIAKIAESIAVKNTFVFTKK